MEATKTILQTVTETVTATMTITASATSTSDSDLEWIPFKDIFFIAVLSIYYMVVFMGSFFLIGFAVWAVVMGGVWLCQAGVKLLPGAWDATVEGARNLRSKYDERRRQQRLMAEARAEQEMMMGKFSEGEGV